MPLAMFIMLFVCMFVSSFICLFAYLVVYMFVLFVVWISLNTVVCLSYATQEVRKLEQFRSKNSCMGVYYAAHITLVKVFWFWCFLKR